MYHLSSNVMFVFSFCYAMQYFWLFGILVDQGPACAVWCVQPWEDKTSPEAAGPNLLEEKRIEKETQQRVRLSLLISLLWASFAKEMIGQHGPLMRISTFAATLPVHNPKWHPCFHIKDNRTCYAWGKGQGFKPQDRYYKWSNNYIAAAGIKANFSVCQPSVGHRLPPSVQKCQVCESDMSRGDGLCGPLCQGSAADHSTQSDTKHVK